MELLLTIRKFPGYTAEWIKLLTSSVARNLGSTPDYVIILCGRDDCLRTKQDTRPVTTPEKVTTLCFFFLVISTRIRKVIIIQLALGQRWSYKLY